MRSERDKPLKPKLLPDVSGRDAVAGVEGRSLKGFEPAGGANKSRKLPVPGLGQLSNWSIGGDGAERRE